MKSAAEAFNDAIEEIYARSDRARQVMLERHRQELAQLEETRRTDVAAARQKLDDHYAMVARAEVLIEEGTGDIVSKARSFYAKEKAQRFGDTSDPTSIWGSDWDAADMTIKRHCVMKVLEASAVLA